MGKYAEMAEFPAVVPLNVGGVQFTTSLETLQNDKFSNCDGDGGSMLASMFSGRIPTRSDAEGRFFIDRDGRLFHHILNYLRDGKFPVGLASTQRYELEREASFYGLEALAAHLRADLKPRAPSDDEAAGITVSPEARRVLPASEAAEQVLNHCLEEWPDFPDFVQQVMDKLYEAGGLLLEDNDAGTSSPSRARANSGVMLDDAVAASLQTDTLAATQVELVHTDPSSKTWRWSDRKTGVNSVLRMKLLRCHLQRLGYVCRIVPLLDKKEVSAYVMQVELPMPS